MSGPTMGSAGMGGPQMGGQMGQPGMGGPAYGGGAADPMGGMGQPGMGQPGMGQQPVNPLGGTMAIDVQPGSQFGAQPGMGGPPPGQYGQQPGGYPQPGQQDPYGGGAGGFGQQPQQGGFGQQPQQGGFGGQPQQGGFGQQPPQGGFGDPNMGQPQPGGYGASPGGGFGGPPQGQQGGYQQPSGGGFGAAASNVGSAFAGLAPSGANTPMPTGPTGPRPKQKVPPNVAMIVSYLPWGGFAMATVFYMLGGVVPLLWTIGYLFYLVGFFGYIGYVALQALMVQDLKKFSNDPVLEQWWMILIPCYGMVVMMTTIRDAVSRARQMAGLSGEVRPNYFYLLLGPGSLATDMAEFTDK